METTIDNKEKKRELLQKHLRDDHRFRGPLNQPLEKLEAEHKKYDCTQHKEKDDVRN